MKKQLQSVSNLLFDPVISIFDFIRLCVFFSIDRVAEIHPKNLRHSVRILNRLEYNIFHEIIRKGAYAFKTSANPKTILDAGANVGFGAVYFASRFPEATICAIEPEARNFERLSEHCRPYKNIVCIQGALCGHGRRLKILDPNVPMHSFKVTDGSEDDEINIQGFTIPEIMEKMGWTKIDILKVDIEGSEVEVFGENFDGWINRVNLMAIEVHDNRDRQASRTVLQALEKINCPFYLRPHGENLSIRRLDEIS